MNGPSTVSPVSEDQLATWCSDWAANGGMGILAKVHLQTLVSHLLSRKMPPGEIQRQLGLAAAGIGAMASEAPSADAGTPAVTEKQKPAVAGEQPEAQPVAVNVEESPAATVEHPEGTLPGLEQS